MSEELTPDPEVFRKLLTATMPFGKYAGTDVKIEGEEHLIMREDDVLGIIE